MINFEKLTKATNIYNRLVYGGQIDLTVDTDIYEELLDEDINDILNTMAGASKLILKKVDRILYALPAMDNEIYGFKEKEIKEKLAAGATRADYYLFNYIVLVILNRFYSSGGENPKLLQHISVNDLIGIVSDSFKGIDDEEKVLKQETYEMNFKAIGDRWEGLLIVDETSKSSLKTKRGVLLRIFKFLQDQDLIRYYENEDIIKTTRRCDDLMKNYFLNYDRKVLINEFFNERMVK